MTTSLRPYRFAWRFALSQYPGTRWRRWSIILTTVLSTLTVLYAAGLWHGASAAEQRKSDRMPEWAAEAADAQLFISESFGEIDAQQFPILWVEKSSAQADPGVPPGFDSFPKPGEAAVSPALADRGMTAQSLGFVPSTATSGRPGIIGADGLGGPDELFAYIVVGSEHSLGDRAQLLPFAGYAPGTADPDSAAYFDLDAPLPAPRELLPLLLIMLVVPASIVQISALSMHSTHRQERMRILQGLGIPRAAVRRLRAAEDLCLTVPSALAASLLWQLGASAISELPGAPAAVAIGELTASWVVVLGWIVGVALLSITGSAIETARSRRRRNPASPERSRPYGAAVLAVVICLLGLLESPWNDGMDAAVRANIFLFCVGVGMLSLPWGLPWLVRAVLLRVPRPRWPELRIALARATFAPMTAARVGALLAAMIVLGTFALALIASRQASQEESPDRTAAISVVWLEEGAAPARAVAARADAAGLELLQLGMDDQSREVVAAEGCRDDVIAALQLDARVCLSALEDPRNLPEDYTGPIPVREVTRPMSSALVIAPTGTRSMDVFRALAPAGAGLSVAAPFRGPVHNYLTEWYGHLLGIGALVLAAAFFRDVADRSLRAVDERAVLFRIGLPEHVAWKVIRWELAIPAIIGFVLAVALGIAAGGFGQGIGLTLLRAGDVLLVALSVSAFAILVALGCTAVVRRRARVEARRGSFRSGSERSER
ncbi:hypothetical protein [Brachybacterium timonense]|uniref:hypothetical protein n=1 Tax=Brachybacterium timonense TaxID=2050896 RepID=UPI000D0BD075|nr:hypothetical protein [Brachybacterium timonense]